MVYLRRLGFSGAPSQLHEASFEVLSDTTITTLEPNLVERFDAETGVAVAWIKGIAFNKTLSFLKQHQRVAYREGAAEGKWGKREEGECFSEDEVLSLFAEQLSQGDDITSDVDVILSSLGADDRKILSLHYLEGYSGRELADQLDIASGAVYVRLSRARQRARQAAVALA
jgi:RNA polymerase sigma factor (sigma-70 family)